MKQLLLLTLFTLSTLFALETNPSDYIIIGVDTSTQKLTPKDIEKALIDAGIDIADNRDMNTPFLKQFNHSDFKVYNLLTYLHKDISTQLIKGHSLSGLFYPASMSIYQKKGDPILWVSFLTASTQSRISGFSKENKEFKKLEEITKRSIVKLFKKPLYNRVTPSKAKDFPAISMHKSTLEVDDDVEEIKCEVEILLEDAIAPLGFVMANFSDVNYVLTKEESIESTFDFYSSYSICKLKVIYNVAKNHPEAGAYAPCTLIMYKEKKSSDIIIAHPSVENWIHSSNITEKASIDVLHQAQKEMKDVMQASLE